MTDRERMSSSDVLRGTGGEGHAPRLGSLGVLLMLLVFVGVVAFVLWRAVIGGGGRPSREPPSVVETDLPEGSWPMFRGNRACTGVATSPLAETLDLLWTVEAGGGISSTAAIVDGAVYVGTDDNRVLSLRLSDGHERWTYRTDDVVSAAPCVAGGRVFVGDVGGVFHAIDAATGAKLWTFTTGGEIRSSATALGELVLVGSYDARLYAFLASGGEPWWSFETEYFVHCSPCVAQGEVIIVGCDNLLRIIDAARGEETARIDVEAYVGATPARVGDRVYVATMAGKVLCVNLDTAGVAWSVQPGEEDEQFEASPAVSGERLVVGSKDNIVRCLSTVDGRELWHFDTRGNVDSSPVVVGSRVFIGSGDGTLYCLSLTTGEKLWDFPAGAGIRASPAVGEGRLVIGAEDGAIYCFGPKQRPDNSL